MIEITRYGTVDSQDRWCIMDRGADGAVYCDMQVPYSMRVITDVNVTTSLDTARANGLVTVRLDGPALLSGRIDLPVAGYRIDGEAKSLNNFPWIPSISVNMSPVPVRDGCPLRVFVCCSYGNMGMPHFAVKVRFQ